MYYNHLNHVWPISRTIYARLDLLVEYNYVNTFEKQNNIPLVIVSSAL